MFAWFPVFEKKSLCVVFQDAKVLINGEPVMLQKRPGPSQIRRIYVRENTRVPTDVGINLSVRMPYNDLLTQEANWVTEAKTLRPGVFLARTLLLDSSGCAAVCTVNLSGREQFLKAGLCLGTAQPGTVSYTHLTLPTNREV